jgi:hypothetical protein
MYEKILRAAIHTTLTTTLCALLSLLTAPPATAQEPQPAQTPVTTQQAQTTSPSQGAATTQTPAATQANAVVQKGAGAPQPLYKEYKGIMLGMSAAESHGVGRLELRFRQSELLKKTAGILEGFSKPRRNGFCCFRLHV